MNINYLFICFGLKEQFTFIIGQRYVPSITNIVYYIRKQIYFSLGILHFIESCNHVIFISSRSVHAAPLLVNDGEVVDAGDDEVSYGAMIKSQGGRMVPVVSSLSLNDKVDVSVTLMPQCPMAVLLWRSECQNIKKSEYGL